MQQHAEEFRAAGAQVLIVAQARPEWLTMFLEGHPLPFPLVGDPGRDGYRAFGLDRASWWTMLRPDVILRYFLLMFRGWLPRRPGRGEDLQQLGGDFILDAEQRLVFVHPSAEPTDRPAVGRLLEEVRKIKPG